MTLPGLVIGLQLLHQPDNAVSVTVLAVVLIVYGCWGWANRQFRIDQKHIPKLNPLVGFLTGCVNGATGSQIFPVMPYLLSLGINKDMLVQTVNISFTMGSLVVLISLLLSNNLDVTSLASYSLGIIPVSLGVWLGGKVRRRLPEERFKQAVMLLIVMLGFMLLI